ncbi:hypothetical protein AB0C07_38365 [Actinoplanes missouriensis]|uniref:hypothetical protein n=1 Tax=Actinoplanes missouriensis TaxID=1866 RepID=UPI0033F044A0
MSSYSYFPGWCTVICLVTALGHLFTVPSWWRAYPASRVRWRDRAFLVIVLTAIVAFTATIFCWILEAEGIEARWAWRILLALYLFAVALLCLIPLVGGWSRLDFAVPPRLRTPSDGPESWAEATTLAHGNRQERRLRGRRKSRARGAGRA